MVHHQRRLTQRAELLETVIADIYGDNTLVQQGLLPPELIARNGESCAPWSASNRPADTICISAPSSWAAGPMAHGGCWATAPRPRPAPASHSKTRVATTRALSDIYADMNIQRLAGFFRAFRDTLFTQAKRDGGRVGILTPGQLNETYFEHAYIARYLGLMLLEGEDLVVEDERVMVRTVAGPQAGDGAVAAHGRLFRRPAGAALR
jgi:uncharacterized circularly permuted ATP-grasp superfamily protein